MKNSPGRSPNKMSGRKHGFTLIELVVVIVVLFIVATMVAAGLSFYTGAGQERDTTRNAQLAQERLELILAEKLKNGFPDSESGCSGPDPCRLYNDGFPGCSEVSVEFFKDGDEEEYNCYDDEDFDYCTVKVSVNDGQTFKMRLYKY